MGQAEIVGAWETFVSLVKENDENNSLSEKDINIFGAAVASEEPLFILRAKDITAAPTLLYYLEHNRKYGPVNPVFLESIEGRLTDFMEWQSQNIDKVRYPD